MDKKSPLSLPHHGFHARETGTIDNGKGYWGYLQIGVFQGDEPIGEYQRNYHTFFDTFYPFRRGDEWFALYSPHYTATSVLRLPDCQNVGGEVPVAQGFCPVEFYVPAYRVAPFETQRGKEEQIYLLERDAQDLWNLSDEETEGLSFSEVRYLPFGFVAGCHWGDDSSWKIQVLDLRNPYAPQRLDHLGYLELPDRMSLKDAVVIQDIQGAEGDETIWFDLAVRKRFTFDRTQFGFRAWND